MIYYFNDSLSTLTQTEYIILNKHFINFKSVIEPLLISYHKYSKNKYYDQTLKFLLAILMINSRI
jgi:hypothetical protein